MLEFKFTCAHCGQHIAVTEAWCGRRLACPSCGTEIEVPAAPPPAAPPPVPPVAVPAVPVAVAIPQPAAASAALAVAVAVPAAPVPGAAPPAPAIPVAMAVPAPAPGAVPPAPAIPVAMAIPTPVVVAAPAPPAPAPRGAPVSALRPRSERPRPLCVMAPISLALALGVPAIAIIAAPFRTSQAANITIGVAVWGCLIASLVCGHSALSEIRSGKQVGRIWAIAGLAIGYSLLFFFALCIIIALFHAPPGAEPNRSRRF